MKNSEQPAFPHMVIETDPIDGSTIRNIEFDGLTKREYFAAMAMQGLLSNGAIREIYSGNNGCAVPSGIAQLSLDYSDALLAELEKPTNESNI